MQLQEIYTDYVFKHVRVQLDNGVELEGYFLDVKLPINEDVFFYFLESNKAKRYLARYNPDWLMPLMLEMVTSVEILEINEISEALFVRRMELY